MNYDDIIDLSHHISKRHRPMSMLNRAAQFAPFAALTGYNDSIDNASHPTIDDFCNDPDFPIDYIDDNNNGFISDETPSPNP